MAIVSCAALVGCASSNAATGAVSSSPAPVETVRLSGGGGTGSVMVETHPSSSSTRITVGFAVDRVWGVLKTAFDSLAIPTSTVDVSSRTMGNGSMRPRRRLGDVALSKYINCGNVQGGPSADSYEVMLSVLTQLQPAELGQTALLTSVEAQARPITIAGEFTRCTSTGAIEKRLAEIVTSKLNR